jgi:hypothetical protein
MHSNKRRLAKVAGFVALTFVAVGLFAMQKAYSDIPYPEAMTIGQGAATFQELSDRFTELAKQKGGVYAFDVLKLAQLPPNTDLHLLGHAIGDVLYAQKGVAGIADCTQDFRNACSHAIVIGTLNEFGAGNATLKMIDDACKQAPGGTGAYTMCYHGLGHGVFAYFGYDLSKTVAFCKRMGTPEYNDEQFTQCVGGAVMELLSGGGHDHDAWVVARENYLVPDRPLAPCDSAVIPEEAKGYCYLYLTPRLFEFAGADIGNPDPATFPRAFTYCDALPLSEGALRDACFGGFGKEFVPLAAGRDIRAIDHLDDSAYSLAAGWCELASPRDGKESCLREALESVFWGGENDTNASFRFCAVVPTDLIDACFADLAGDIGHYLRGDNKTQWCAKLPEQYRNQCAS